MPTIRRDLGIILTPETGINQLFFEPFFQSVMNMGMFRVITNVRNKKKLGFVRRLEKILQAATGCGFTPKGGIEVFDRIIEVNPVKVNLSMCVDDFKDTVFEQTTKTGNGKTDLTGTPMMQALILAVRDALPDDLARLFWFGDKSTNDPFYNLSDGLWTVYLEQLVQSGQSPYTNTNSGSPIPPGGGRALLSQVYKAQSKALKGLSKAERKFFVTDSVWEAYQDDLENFASGGELGSMRVINGVETLTYRGIQLINNPNWDLFTTNELGNPESHLILLTTPKNLIVATNTQSDQNRVEVWHDRKDEDTNLKINFKFGANFVHAAFFSVGF